MMKKSIFFSILAILLLGLAYFFWFNFEKGFVLIGWDIGIPLQPQTNVKYLSMWVDNNNGTIIMSSLHFLILLYSFLSKFSLSLTTIQFIHVYTIHVVGALSIFYLAHVLLSKHPQKILISLLAGITYLFSPAFLNMYFAYTSIGFVPLALALFIDGMSRKRTYLFALAIGLVMSLAGLPDPHPRPPFLILTPIFLYAALEAYVTKKVKRILSYLFLVLLFIFLLNAWFFLGFISNAILDSRVISIAKEVPFTFGVNNKFGEEGTALIMRMVRLFHDNLPLTAARLQFFVSNWIMILANYSRPLLAFSALLFLKNKEKKIAQNMLFLVILALTFLFLAKSVNPPFGSLYRFALEYIPIFRVFRHSSYFILGTAIAYSILVPFTVVEIVKYFGTYKRLAVCAGIVLLILSLVNSYPILLRYQAYLQPDPAKPAELGMKIPPDYYRLAGYIDSQPEDSKTISLPLDPGYEILKEDPWYFGIPMLPWIMRTPIINQRVRDFSGSFSLPIIIENELIEGNETSVFLLNISNIRYIIVKNNATNIDKLKANTNISKHYRLVKTFGNYLMYENPSYLPHVYVPDRIVITDSVPEQIAGVINTNNLRDKEAIYFTLQNTKQKIDMLESLKREMVKLPAITYKKMSQTKYLVTVRNASSDFPLIFSETFHYGWKLYLRRSLLPDTYHVEANSFANSWIVKPSELCRQQGDCSLNPDQSYNFELSLEYFPQEMSNAGYLMSIVTIIITSLYFIYEKLRKI